MLFLLAGPPGAGKTTTARLLRRQRPRLRLLRTWTTRPPRADDPGRCDYHYVTEPVFSAATEAGGFLETIEFGGYRYGTPEDDVLSAASISEPALIVMSLGGALELRSAVANTFLVYLECSIEEVTQRLRGRGDQPPALDMRVAHATHELRSGDYRRADRVVSSRGSLAETVFSLATAIDEVDGKSG